MSSTIQPNQTPADTYAMVRNLRKVWGTTANACVKCKQPNTNNPLGNFCLSCLKKPVQLGKCAEAQQHFNGMEVEQ